MPEKTKTTIRLPRKTLDLVAQVAESLGVTRNAFVTLAVVMLSVRVVSNRRSLEDVRREFEAAFSEAQNRMRGDRG